jgi:hypothetical protein
MRQFNITINWPGGHTDIVTAALGPNIPADMTVGEFQTLMLPCIAKAISACSQDAQDYLILIFGELYLSDMGDGIITAVEEI